MGLLFRHRASFGHETGAHPENAGRIAAIERALDDAGWAGLEPNESPGASHEMLARVHRPEHIERIEGLCASGGGFIDADTLATEGSWEAALRAAGAAAAGAERLLGDGEGFAFCMHRPPGHHAESDRAMGFCLLNSAAVGAAHAIAACGARRVLVFDWDVHHGNGTAEILESRDDVLFVSIHQSPLYPGTGAASEIGTGAGEGLTVNLPVPAGSGGAEYVGLAQHVVAPLGRRFAPDLIVISAGYDAHADDPLAGCELTTADFGEMAASVRDLGSELGAPVLACLEGGYEPEALAASVLATVRALGGDRAPRAYDAGPARDAQRRLEAQERWAGAFI